MIDKIRDSEDEDEDEDEVPIHRKVIAEEEVSADEQTARSFQESPDRRAGDTNVPSTKE